MILLIDNYDSFTFNLVHYLGGLGAQVDVHRNDKISVDDVLARDPDAIVLSPGPCTPNEAGICLDLIKRASAHIPIFGVCLGHQAIGQAFGGSVIRAPVPVHGKLSEIRQTGAGVFHGINGPFRATRYHSLIVDRKNLPQDLEVTAETTDHPDHGDAPPPLSGSRRAIPSREHRLRAWPLDLEEFSRHSRAMECRHRPVCGAAADRTGSLTWNSRHSSARSRPVRS